MIWPYSATLGIYLQWEGKGGPFGFTSAMLPVRQELMAAGAASTPQTCIPKSTAACLDLV